MSPKEKYHTLSVPTGHLRVTLEALKVYEPSLRGRKYEQIQADRRRRDQMIRVVEIEVEAK